jgi:hypothetical protein
MLALLLEQGAGHELGGGHVRTVSAAPGPARPAARRGAARAAPRGAAPRLVAAAELELQQRQARPVALDGHELGG